MSVERHGDLQRRVELLFDTFKATDYGPLDPLVIAAETAAYIDAAGYPPDAVAGKVAELMPPGSTPLQHGLAVVMALALPSLRNGRP